MQLSRSLRNVILIELLLPVTLLILGIYHGLMQTIYRSGAIHQSSAIHLDYYQGLTLHGVINAIVLTSFFAVAFGHATIAFHLKKEPDKKVAWLSLWLMVIGTLLAAWPCYLAMHLFYILSILLLKRIHFSTWGPLS